MFPATWTAAGSLQPQYDARTLHRRDVVSTLLSFSRKSRGGKKVIICRGQRVDGVDDDDGRRSLSSDAMSTHFRERTAPDI